MAKTNLTPRQMNILKWRRLEAICNLLNLYTTSEEEYQKLITGLYEGKDFTEELKSKTSITINEQQDIIYPLINSSLENVSDNYAKVKQLLTKKRDALVAYHSYVNAFIGYLSYESKTLEVEENKITDSRDDQGKIDYTPYLKELNITKDETIKERKGLNYIHEHQR